MSGLKQVQAKDISDDAFIAAVRSCIVHAIESSGLPNATANRFDVAACLGFPEKVVLAKARKIIRQGRMVGCACGCRGDFDLPRRSVVRDQRDETTRM